VQIYDRHDHTHGLNVFVGKPQPSDSFSPADFVKLCVVTVINQTHLVGQRVMNADGGGIGEHAGWLRLIL